MYVSIYKYIYMSHRLPQVCTQMTYGKLGGVSLAGKTHDIPDSGAEAAATSAWKFHKFPQTNGRPLHMFSIAGVFAVAH
jgi:hypothetical protein